MTRGIRIGYFELDINSFLKDELKKIDINYLINLKNKHINYFSTMFPRSNTPPFLETQEEMKFRIIFESFLREVIFTNRKKLIQNYDKVHSDTLQLFIDYKGGKKELNFKNKKLNLLYEYVDFYGVPCFEIRFMKKNDFYLYDILNEYIKKNKLLNIHERNINIKNKFNIRQTYYKCFRPHKIFKKQISIFNNVNLNYIKFVQLIKLNKINDLKRKSMMNKIVN